MSREADLIYDILEESLKVNRWAPLILKTIVEESKKSQDGWCHLSYREWSEYGINTFTFNRAIKWAVENKIVESKDMPQGGKRGKKRKMYRLHFRR